MPLDKKPQSAQPTASWLENLVLADGTVVRFRHVRPEDAPLVAEAIRTSSARTLTHRFFSPIRELPAGELKRALTVNPESEVCLVGVIDDQVRDRIVCGIRYVRLTSPEAAEIALTVHDDFQNRGIGTFMVKLLARLAYEKGIRRFEADVLAENGAMLHVFRKITPHLVSSTVAGVCHLSFQIPLS
jgi:RimJ/RimL family protein N-acetyltransferase